MKLLLKILSFFILVVVLLSFTLGLFGIGIGVVGAMFGTIVGAVFSVFGTLLRIAFRIVINPVILVAIILLVISKGKRKGSSK